MNRKLQVYHRRTREKRRKLLPLARAGDAQAQFEIGCEYDFERPRRRHVAIRWYLKAAKQGHPKAQNYLYESYRDGWTVKRNLKEALKWLQLAAVQDEPNAQTSLGVMYFNGTGVRKDWKAALKWYRRGARNGNDHAQYNIAQMYRRGEGLPQSWVQARKWYSKAANNGNADAMNWLRKLYEGEYSFPKLRKDEKKAFLWAKRAAETGTPQYQAYLGVHYINGVGTAADYKTGAMWYRRAVENGDGWACYLLGLCYRDGWGVPLNSRLARHYFRKAIARKENEGKKALARMDAGGVAGEAERLEKLGDTYRLGDGVSQSWTDAIASYKRAAKKGSVPAMSWLAQIYSDYYRRRQPKNEFLWLRRAAIHGDVYSQVMLGLYYFGGDKSAHIPLNKTAGVTWLRKAALNGDGDACFYVGNCYRDGMGVRSDKRAARHWYRRAIAKGERVKDARRALAALKKGG